MDPAVAEEFFEPFRQASEEMSREYEGISVGLAMTRKATEEMGGSNEVDTRKGEGSRFTVRLPLGDGGGTAVTRTAGPAESKLGNNGRQQRTCASEP